MQDRYPRRFRIKKLTGSLYPWKVTDREWPHLLMHCRTHAAAIATINRRLADERRVS
jgi:hypothetical protein